MSIIIILILKKYKKCPDYNKLYLNDHNCNNNRIVYFHSQVKKDVKYLKIESNEEDEEINYENDILYFDFETFQDGINFSVCAVGFVLDGFYNYFYGKDSLVRFVEVIMRNPGKILRAYNGCRFDFILLLKQLLTQNENLEVNGLIENNGRIMQYLFNECKMFDLCNFTLSKL